MTLICSIPRVADEDYTL